MSAPTPEEARRILRELAVLKNELATLREEEAQLAGGEVPHRDVKPANFPRPRGPLHGRPEWCQPKATGRTACSSKAQAPNLAASPDQVTCKNCLRVLKAPKPGEPGNEGPVDAYLTTAETDLPVDDESLPVFTRQTLACHHAMHRESNRFGMHGLHVDGFGVTGTDGKVLVHVTHNGSVLDRVKPLTFSADTIKALRKAVGAKGVATWEEGAETVSVPGGSLSIRPANGAFPPYRDVLDQYEPGPLEGKRVEIGFSPGVMLQVLKAAKEFCPKGVLRFTVHFEQGKAKAAAIRIDCRDPETQRRLIALVMPLNLGR